MATTKYHAKVSFTDVNTSLVMEQHPQRSDNIHVYMHRRILDESYVPMCKGSDHKKLSPASLERSMRAGPSRTHASGRKEENMAQRCTHLDQIQEVTPSANGCEDCLKIGDSWVHLRLCLTCGHVGCCDSSKNKHATRHFHATNHPIIQSFQPGEDWVWCYIDQVMLEPA